VQTGFRFCCYPSLAQQEILWRWIGGQEYSYNGKVQEDRYFRTFARKALGLPQKYPPIDGTYAQFLGEGLPEWLKGVPSVIFRNGAVKWKQTYARYFKGLGGRPKLKTKHGRRSVWITSELYAFIPVVDESTGEILKHKLVLGTKKFPFGELEFHAHRDFSVPKSIHISIEAGKWFLSFNNDDGVDVPDKKETLEWLQQFSEEELLARTFGGDRGVAIPLAGNHGETFDYSPTQKERMEKKERRRKRHQRKMARQRFQSLKEKRKTGNNYQKAKERCAKAGQYAKNVRKDFAHKTSHAIVSNPQNLLIVFEKLNTQGMTKAPKPKKDEAGKYIRNGAAAKAGLSKKILASSWGKILEFTKYKAINAGKLCIEIDPYQTSQECSNCGHTHQDNRVSQALFVCQACGYKTNADLNAAKVVAKRGAKAVLSKDYSFKESKRCSIFKQGSIGQELSNSKPVEFQVSRGTRNSAAHRTTKQEALLAMEETPTIMRSV
jgi:putative transposase